MKKVETKVVAASVASPFVALIIWGLGLFGVDIDPQAATGIVILATPLVAFAGGFLKSSKTSAVSEAFIDRQAPRVARVPYQRDDGYTPLQTVVVALVIVILIVILVQLVS